MDNTGNLKSLSCAVCYRAAASFYFAVPLKIALSFNGIDLVIGIIAYLAFDLLIKESEHREFKAVLLGHGLSCAVAFLAVRQISGPIDPLVALALTVGSVILSTFFAKMRSIAI